MSLEEASTYLGIGQEELREIEEGRKAIAPTEKKRLMRAYSHYLAEGNGQGQDLIPIQGGGVCGEEGGELSEAMKVLAKDSLIRKSREDDGRPYGGRRSTRSSSTFRTRNSWPG